MTKDPAGIASKKASQWRRFSHRHVKPNLSTLVRRLKARPAANAPRLAPPILWAWGLIVLVIVLGLLPFDSAISRSMLQEADGVLAFMRWATDVGLVRWYVYPLILFVALASLVDWSSFARNRKIEIARLYGHAIYALTAVGSAGIITQIGKRLFGRARPELLDTHGSFSFETLRIAREFASFPSGHATTVGAVTLVLCVWFPALRLPLLAAGGAFALSRIVVRAHFPSDVVAGFAIGAFVAILMARALAQRGLLYAFRADGQGRNRVIPSRPKGRRFVKRPLS